MYSGPSGGDINGMRMAEKPGLVITSLGENKFNVDMYLPTGQAGFTVIDLGVYTDE